MRLPVTRGKLGKPTLFAAAAVAALALPATAPAHESHGSCKVFGNATSELAQQSAGSFGAFVSAAPPKEAAMKYVHAAECEPRF